MNQVRDFNQLLADAGANIDLKNSDGKTPIDLCCIPLRYELNAAFQSIEKNKAAAKLKC